MQPHEHFRRNVRGVYAFIGAVAIAGGAPALSDTFIKTGGPVGRAAGVIVNAVGWIPLFAVTVAMIRRGDEFQQRIHFVALGVAFGAVLLLLSLLDALGTAGFMAPPSMRALWVALAAIWWVSWMVVKYRFERNA